MARYDRTLREFPWLREEIEPFGSAMSALAARQRQLGARRALVENDILVRQLGIYPGRAPEEVLTRALQDPRFMNTLLRTVRGTEGEQALRRAVWQRVVGTLGPDFMTNPHVMLDFINRHRDSLGQMFSERHVQNLDTVYNALRINLGTPLPKGVAPDPNPMGRLTQRFGSGPLQISSRIFAAEQGRLSYRFAATDLFSRMIIASNRNEADALLKQALFDEDIARELARSTRIKKDNARARRRIGTYLFSLGFSGGEEGPRGTDLIRRHFEGLAP